MERRGILLRGIARVLNAGGSALVNLYDAATAMKTIVVTGEKGDLGAQLREYERKIAGLYHDIGKEVELHEGRARLSATGEAGIKRVAEYQAEMEAIRRRIRQIEAEEKAAFKKADLRVRPENEKVAPEARVSAVTEIRQSGPVQSEAAPEEPISLETIDGAVAAEHTEAAEESAEIMPAVAAEVLPEADATGEPESQEGTADPEMVTETTAAAEPEADPLALEALLKSDLLQMCSEKGIEADKRMTKAEIIELISRHE